MIHHGRTRATCGALMLLWVLALSEPCSAGRFVPEPLLIQFESGYGIVAAQVVRTSKVSEGDKYPAFYDTTFKVVAVPAQPVEGDPFPLRAGDQITVRLSLGYACQIEEDADYSLAPGLKYFLALKHETAGTYKQVDGASSPRRVREFSKDELLSYAQARKLVAVPKPQRPGKWLDCIKDPTAPDMLRRQAVWGLKKYLWPVSKLDPAQAHRTFTVLNQTWNDPASNLSIDLLESLDYLLSSINRDFDKSPERASGWLVHLFAPTPELRKDNNDRDNLAMGILRQLIAARPREVGQRLVVEMFNPNWPPTYRRAISVALMIGYCEAPTPDPAWEPALQTYYATGLSHESDPFPIRMMAVDIRSGLTMPNSSRKFIANTKVRDALVQAVVRLSTFPRNGLNDYEPGVAMNDCKAALAALGN